jgi:elongation factor G
LGGVRHYAKVQLRLLPAGRGNGTMFLNLIPEDRSPRPPIEAIESAVQESFTSGVLAGYPVTDIKVILESAQTIESQPSEMAFRVAASMAFRQGCLKARPILLEPIMKLEIIVPDEFLGEVIGDLNARKGKIEQLFPQNKVQHVQALVPLSQMFGYSTALRSSSQGRATFTMQFSHYSKAVTSQGQGTPK